MYGVFDPRPLKSGQIKGGRSYLLVDNRVSGGQVLEQNTLTCGHCNCVVLLNPARTRERGHCRRCNHYVCDKPGCRLGCNPTDEGIDLAFANPAAAFLGQAFVGRAPDGAILFDPRLRDRKRIH